MIDEPEHTNVEHLQGALILTLNDAHSASLNSPSPNTVARLKQLVARASSQLDVLEKAL